MSGKSRIEKILENLLGGDNVIEPPIGRDEKILYSILNDTEYTEPPHSIFEDFLLAIKNGSATETTYMYEYLTRDEKILFCKLNRLEYFEPPHSRLEKLLIKWLYLDLYLNIDGVPPFTFISNGSPLIDYLISGSTVQTGTPTQDSPIMLQGTGERTGNLFDVSTVEKGRIDNGVVGYASATTDLTITGNKIEFTTNANFRGVCGGFIEIPNGTESISFYGTFKGGNGIGRKFVFYDAQKTWLNKDFTIGIADNGGTATIPNGAKFVRMSFTAQAPVAASISNFILNSGSTALPFEPYGYKIQILSGEVTTPVYLGEVETTRKIKKLVLDGTEAFYASGSWGKTNTAVYYTVLPNAMNLSTNVAYTKCSHYVGASRNYIYDNDIECLGMTGSNSLTFRVNRQYAGTKEDFLAYLAQQYAAGTPVTVWYVLATEETAVVNEPLMKIGDYADSISYEQTVVSIPTVSGKNTFDVLGDVKPSNVEITYAPRAPLLGKRKTILKK